MIQLRDYQQNFIDNIKSSMRKNKHILCQLPCGGGKTICFSYIAQNALRKNRRVIIFSNRTELLFQAGGTLEKFGIKAGYVSPKHKTIPTEDIVVTMAQTMQRRYEKPEWDAFLRTFDLYIIDEAHLCDFNFLLEYDNSESIGAYLKDKFVLGFTATPHRTGKMRQLGLDYQDIVKGVYITDLIGKGFLCQGRYFAIDAPDLSKVEINPLDGDYNSRQLAFAYDKKVVYKNMIDEYKRVTGGSMQALCFCASQVHSIQTCVELNEAGINAKFLISGISKTDESAYTVYEKYKHLTGERDSLINDFKDNKFTILCNTGILTTGYDHPELPCVILNMSTKSLTKMLQIVGRASRIAQDKQNFYCLDFGNNIKEHGAYEANRQWGLWHHTASSSGIAPTKECPFCHRLIAVQYQECPFCGYKYPTRADMRIAELTEIVGDTFKYTDMTPQQLVATAELKGYSKHWAFNMLYTGGGLSGFKKGMKELGYDYKFIWSYIKRKGWK